MRARNKMRYALSGSVIETVSSIFLNGVRVHKWRPAVWLVYGS